MLKASFKTAAEAEAYGAALFLAETLDRDNKSDFRVRDLVYREGEELPYVVLIDDNRDPTTDVKVVSTVLLPTQPDWA